MPDRKIVFKLLPFLIYFTLNRMRCKDLRRKLFVSDYIWPPRRKAGVDIRMKRRLKTVKKSAV